MQQTDRRLRIVELEKEIGGKKAGELKRSVSTAGASISAIQGFIPRQAQVLNDAFDVSQVYAARLRRALNINMISHGDLSGSVRFKRANFA